MRVEEDLLEGSIVMLAEEFKLLDTSSRYVRGPGATALDGTIIYATLLRESSHEKVTVLAKR